MKVLFITDAYDCWKHGIWWHRIEIPTRALLKRGHGVKQVAMGDPFPEKLMEWPDVVVFGRTYPAQYNPVKIMREYKELGKRVIYDMDDDFWQVAKDNLSVLVSNAMKDQYEGMIRECDAVITPSKVLQKKFKKHFKMPIHICPNAVDTDVYLERPHKSKELVIGYMGAASHWKDLQIIGPVLKELSKKNKFVFKIYGITGEPLEAAIYSYRKIMQSKLVPEKDEYFRAAIDFYETLEDVPLWHVPFMPPELHPRVLSGTDMDIGLAPLEDTVFNKGKSCIKFYEYASVGTVTLASNVTPYKEEVGYLAKNTQKDWLKKLEKLIVDKDFREKLLKKQQDYVLKNRTIDTIGLDWELAIQRPSKGPKVLNQSR